LVTGANRGVGRAIALAFAREVADVAEGVKLPEVEKVKMLCLCL